MSEKEISGKFTNNLGLSAADMDLLPGHVAGGIEALSGITNNEEALHLAERIAADLEKETRRLEEKLAATRRAKDVVSKHASEMEKKIEQDNREKARKELLTALDLPADLRVVDNEIYGESVIVIKDEVRGLFCLVDSKNQKIIGGKWLKSKALNARLALSRGFKKLTRDQAIAARVDIFPDLYEGDDGKKYIILHNIVTQDGKKSEAPQIAEFHDLKYLRDTEFKSENSMYTTDAFVEMQDGKKYIYDGLAGKYIELPPNMEFESGMQTDTGIGNTVLGEVENGQGLAGLYSYRNLNFDGFIQMLPPFYNEIKFLYDSTRYVLCFLPNGKVCIGDALNGDTFLVGPIDFNKKLLKLQNPTLEQVLNCMKLKNKDREQILKDLKFREEIGA